MKKSAWLLPILLIVIFAVFTHSRLLGMFADSDSFYHIKHSWLYRTDGIFQTAFPWVQYSVINQHSADLWYGYHILITPLTLFSDLLKGIALGEVLTAITALFLAFLTFKHLRLKWPLFWTFLFALATADLLYRLNMLRPHPLSLGLALLLFANLAANSKPRSQNSEVSQFNILNLFRIPKLELKVFLLGFAVAWLHLSLSWLPILIAISVLLLEIIRRKRIFWLKYSALAGGLLAGWAARPNPVGALKLAYIQVAQLLLEKQGDLPLRFGRELTPFVWENFVDQHIPLALFFISALIFLVWKWRRGETAKLSDSGEFTAIGASLFLTAIFTALTFGVARRSNELMVGFGIIFIALIFSWWFSERHSRLRRLPAETAIYTIGALILLIYAPIKTIYRLDTYAANAFPPLRFQEVGAWLNSNARPGEIVYNIHWDRFAELFFWNHRNYYINGMDPIFEYSFNRSLYWKSHFLHTDEGGAFTCAMIRCSAEEVIPTYEVLKNDFRAFYVVVEKRRNPRFLEYLENYQKFEKVFETQQQAIFKVL